MTISLLHAKICALWGRMASCAAVANRRSSNLAALLALLTLSHAAPVPSPQPAAPMQLWYWHHSYLVSDEALQKSKALVDKAAALGYNGAAIWDSSFNFMGTDFWPAENEGRMRELMKHAAKKHMSVLATPGPFGLSNEVLRADPNWAEGLRVTGAQFQVDPTGQRLMLKNSFSGLANPGFEEGKSAWFSMGDSGVGINATAHAGKVSGVIVDAPGNGRLHQKFPLKPWRQYHLRLFFKSSQFRGSAMLSVFDGSNIDKARLTGYLSAAGTHDWTQADYLFNSQDSTEGALYVGVWGGSSGVLWFDDVQIEETALVYVVRRSGAPLKVYDPENPGTLYREGSDYNFITDPRMTATRTPFTDVYHDPAPVTLPRGTHLKPGQIVAIDFYAAVPVPHLNGVAMCMTEPGVQKWLVQNARALKRVLPSGGNVLVSYDEIRQMNSCASCKAKNLTPGQLLAWSVAQTFQTYRSIIPDATFYEWNDMFDPYHNAHDNYYYVEGDLSGSWKGLPAGIRILNWNLGDLKNSLTWFSGRDTRQPVPHQQIVAGYYDNNDGARSAQEIFAHAAGIPGILGVMYTSWGDDYSQLESFAKSARAAWSGYLSSLPKETR
jgi:hypothetical protein